MILSILPQVAGNGFPFSLIVFGAVGGFTLNMLNLLEILNVPKGQRSDFKDPLYWVFFVFWPVFGGLLAYAYEASGKNLNEILAINIGASGPFILRGVATSKTFSKSTITPGEGA